LTITVRDNNVEKALRTFKRRLQKEGVFREIKKRRFHEKPSLRKKRKRREAARRRAKALRRGGR
jgi:small subunit ribosomal protein S21